VRGNWWLGQAARSRSAVRRRFGGHPKAQLPSGPDAGFVVTGDVLAGTVRTPCSEPSRPSLGLRPRQCRNPEGFDLIEIKVGGDGKPPVNLAVCVPIQAAHAQTSTAWSPFSHARKSAPAKIGNDVVTGRKWNGGVRLSSVLTAHHPIAPAHLVKNFFDRCE
jgi:hypothetical protein